MDLKELPDRAFARHPWEIARADFFLRLLREHIERADLRVLDIGSGDAYFAKRLLAELAGVAQVTGFDSGYEAAWLAEHAHGEPRLALVAERPSATFDLVLLLDVLEHATDEQGLMGQALASTAAPGGWLLASAPAHPWLYSRHDRLLGHQRRYAPAQLRALALAAGLELVAHGQLFASLLVPRVLAKLGETMWGSRVPAPASGRIRTALGSWHHGALVTSAARRMLALDAGGLRLAARWQLPLPGLSTWVLARRR